jgi:hypothetical protein
MQELKKHKYLLYIIIYFSLFSFLIFTFYGFKVSNDEMCSTNTIRNEDSVLTKTITNSETHTFFPSLPSNYDQNVLETRACLDIAGNNTDFLTVDINGVKAYVNNATTGWTCVDDIVFSGNLSISCDTCTNDNALTTQLSTETGIHLDGTIVNTNYPQYILGFREHCKELYKDLMQYYGVFLALMLFIYLFIRGRDWFERWVFQW